MDRIVEVHARTGKCPWLLVAVNKADLFYDSIAEVEAYYRPDLSSEFSEALKDLQKRVDANSIRVKTVPIAAWAEDFEWSNDRVLSHLGEEEARALFRNMRDKVKSFVEIAGKYKWKTVFRNTTQMIYQNL